MQAALIEKSLLEHQETIQLVKSRLISSILSCAVVLCEAIRGGQKLLVCGNGGSAADAQHLAAELVGRFESERKGLAAIALTTDTSILTAVGNDFGFASVFSRQVEALAVPGDIVVGISTSGNSENVLLAIEKAAELGCKTIALTGRSGGRIASIADMSLNIEVERTARIQEAHLLIIHLLCEQVDLALKTRGQI